MRFIPFIVIGIIVLYLIINAIKNRRHDRLTDYIINNDMSGLRKSIKPSLGNLYYKMKTSDLTQALGTALRHGRSDMARLFLELGADPKSVPYYCLERACFFRNYNSLELILDKGIDPDIRALGYDQTFLMMCIEKGDNDFAEKLLAKGANVNAADKNKNTPLLLAIWNENEHMVRELLKRGADADAVNNNGYTPLELVLAEGSLDFSLILVKHGCHVKEGNGEFIVSALPKDFWSYVNNKWGISFKFPKGWEVVWENEPDGGWEIVVGVKGISSFSGQTVISLRVLPHPALNFQPENVTVYASGDGTPMELPRTPEEHAEKCKEELMALLPIMRFAEEETGSLAGMPSSTLSYYIKSRTGIIKEKQINIFGQQSTYRFLCEMPLELSVDVERFFDSMVANFQPY